MDLRQSAIKEVALFPLHAMGNPEMSMPEFMYTGPSLTWMVGNFYGIYRPSIKPHCLMAVYCVFDEVKVIEKNSFHPAAFPSRSSRIIEPTGPPFSPKWPIRARYIER